MQGWQSPYLGQRKLARHVSQFELQAFVSFSAAEREVTIKLKLASSGSNALAVVRPAVG